MSARHIGILLIVGSALIFSSTGLFIKSVTASAWDIVFWRGVFAAILTWLVILFSGRQQIEFAGMGRWGLIVALLGASGTAAFIPAFKYTDISNVALIFAAAPLIAALVAWLWIRERPNMAVIVGALIAFLGVGLIVYGSLGQVNLIGDLLALWMTIVMALLIVIYRKFPDLVTAGPVVLSCIVLLPISFVLGDPMSVPMAEMGILAAFGLVFAAANVGSAEGAKRLPSGETALLSALESPFAILLAWWVLTEIPVLMTIVGGCLIMLAVVGSQFFAEDLKSQTPPEQSGHPSNP